MSKTLDEIVTAIYDGATTIQILFYLIDYLREREEHASDTVISIIRAHYSGLDR